MEAIPETVTVLVPACVGIRHGRESTAPPYGYVTSVRMHEDTVDYIDRARALLDPYMTRNAFMTIAIERIALAICQHNDRYLAWIKEKQDEQGLGPEAT